MLKKRGWWIALLIAGLAALCLYLVFRRCYSVLDKSLLTKPASAKGWQGIIPGETTREEALGILKKSPYVRGASIRLISGGDIAWDNELLNLGFSPVGPEKENRIFCNDDRVVVVSIRPTYVITVEQVIAHFGQPEKVARYDTRGFDGGLYTAIYLLYPEQGLAVTIRNLITPGSTITEICYFEPVPSDELFKALGFNTLGFSYIDLRQMEDWAGYEWIPDP